MGDMRTWEIMETKLEDHDHLLPLLTQDTFGNPHHLTQGTMSVEEYNGEFEKLLIKCDRQESKGQAIVRYVGGFNFGMLIWLGYNNILHMMMFVLAYRVEQQKKIS